MLKPRYLLPLAFAYHALAQTVLHIPAPTSSPGTASITLTTNGTSGPASLSGSTLNIPQYSGGTSSGPTGPAVANSFYAGPTVGAAATPTFRALVSGDLPASLQLTGTPTAPDGVNSGAFSQIATYDYVNQQLGAVGIGANATGPSCASFTLAAGNTTGQQSLYATSTGIFISPVGGTLCSGGTLLTSASTAPPTPALPAGLYYASQQGGMSAAATSLPSSSTVFADPAVSPTDRFGYISSLNNFNLFGKALSAQLLVLDIHKGNFLTTHHNGTADAFSAFPAMAGHTCVLDSDGDALANCFALSDYSNFSGYDNGPTGQADAGWTGRGLQNNYTYQTFAGIHPATSVTGAQLGIGDNVWNQTVAYVKPGATALSDEGEEVNRQQVTELPDATGTISALSATNISPVSGQTNPNNVVLMTLTPGANPLNWGVGHPAVDVTTVRAGTATPISANTLQLSFNLSEGASTTCNTAATFGPSTTLQFDQAQPVLFLFSGCSADLTASVGKTVAFFDGTDETDAKVVSVNPAGNGYQQATILVRRSHANGTFTYFGGAAGEFLEQTSDTQNGGTFKYPINVYGSTSANTVVTGISKTGVLFAGPPYVHGGAVNLYHGAHIAAVPPVNGQVNGTQLALVGNDASQFAVGDVIAETGTPYQIWQRDNNVDQVNDPYAIVSGPFYRALGTANQMQTETTWGNWIQNDTSGYWDWGYRIGGGVTDGFTMAIAPSRSMLWVDNPTHPFTVFGVNTLSSGALTQGNQITYDPTQDVIGLNSTVKVQNLNIYNANATDEVFSVGTETGPSTIQALGANGGEFDGGVYSQQGQGHPYNPGIEGKLNFGSAEGINNQDHNGGTFNISLAKQVYTAQQTFENVLYLGAPGTADNPDGTLCGVFMFPSDTVDDFGNPTCTHGTLQIGAVANINITDGTTTLGPLNTPSLTSATTAITPPSGDSSQLIPTTGWVQGELKKLSSNTNGSSPAPSTLRSAGFITLSSTASGCASGFSCGTVTLSAAFTSEPVCNVSDDSGVVAAIGKLVSAVSGGTNQWQIAVSEGGTNTNRVSFACGVPQ